MNLEYNFQYNKNMSGEEILKIICISTGKKESIIQNTRTETKRRKETCF